MMNNSKIEELEKIVEQVIKNPNDDIILVSAFDIMYALLWEDLTLNQYLEIDTLLSKLDDEKFNFDNYKAFFAHKSNNNEKANGYLMMYIETLLSNNDISASEKFVSLYFLKMTSNNTKYNEKIWEISIDLALRNNSEDELSLILSGFKEKNIEKSIDCYIKAIEKNAESWISLHMLGNLYYEQKNYYTAIKYYSDYIEIQNELKNESTFLMDTFFYLGGIYDVLKNYPESEKAYRSCIQLFPEYEYANNNLGYCLIKQGKYNESLKIFNDCIKKNIDGEYPIFNKIRVLKKLGEYDKALDFIAKHEKSVKGKKTIIKLKEDVLKSKNKQDKNTKEVESSEPELIPIVPIMKIEDDQKTTNIIDPYSNERGLEFILEQRIRHGDKVFGRKLKMFVEHGRQYYTPIGRIDLLTIDEETNEIIIIELKKGESDDEVVGQISRYIGFIKEKFAIHNQNVKGIIYVYSATEKLKYAAKCNNDMMIHEYKFGLY